MTLRERLCWVHPGDEDVWTTDYVGLRNEYDQIVPACRSCADRIKEPWRLRDGSEAVG